MIVYGSARKPEDIAKLKSAKIKPLSIEMADDNSLTKAVEKVIKERGKIDVLFNNAGYGLYGPVETVSIDEARKQFEVNLFGLARLTQLVLPHMRENGSGTIINTSSIGGKIYTPLGAWYHATKHALEGWSDALRLELKPFNINVVILEPGGVETAWGEIASDYMRKSTVGTPYESYGRKVADSLSKTYEQPGRLASPEVIAEVVYKAIKSDRPKTRYAAGTLANQALLARKFLSDRMFDSIVERRIKE